MNKQNNQLDPAEFGSSIYPSAYEFGPPEFKTEEDRLEYERQTKLEQQQAIEDDIRLDQVIAQFKNDPDLLKQKENASDKAFVEEFVLRYADRNDLERLRKCLDVFPEAIKTVDDQGYNVLHRACPHPNAELIRFLIKRGAAVEGKTVDGWRPIHVAAYWGTLPALHALICYGVDINALTNSGCTCLHLAAQRADRLLLECLVYNPDIDLTIRNAQNDTAYDIAKRNSVMYQLWHNVRIDSNKLRLDYRDLITPIAFNQQNRT